MPESTEPKPTPTGEQPVTNGALHHEFIAFFRKQFGGNVIALVIVGGGAVLGAWKAVAQEARNQADAGVVPVTLRVEDLGRRVERVEKQVPEIQADIRALYRAVMTGQAQPRLEVPALPQDGGR